MEVRVIGSKADSLQRIPGSGTLVTEKEIRRAQPYDTAEMLRRVPGVQVRQDYGGGGRLDVSIRGLESGRSRRVLMLEDGIPVSLNPYAEPDMYYAPPVERLRGIEVVKGSGNILFGPQTIGGVVNFLTLIPPPQPTAVVDAEGGDRGYLRGLAGYGDSMGSVRYVVQAMHKRGDGLRDIAFRTTNVFTKVAFDTGKDGELTLKLDVQHDDNDSDAVGLTREMYRQDPRRPSIAVHDAMVLRRYSASAIHEQHFGKNTTLKTLVYAYQTNRIWRRQDYTRRPAPGIGYERIVGDVNLPNGAIFFQNTGAVLDRTYEVGGIEPRLEQRFRTGEAAHTLDVGGRILLETSAYDQRATDRVDSYRGTSQYAEDRRTLGLAAYVQDRIAFRPDLLVTPGIRFEQAAYTRTITRQNVGGVVQDLQIEGSGTTRGLIPGIGMVVGTKAANVFGGMHMGWAPPRVTAAITPRGAPAQLDAEQSINYELGSRLAPTKWLRLEGTGFLSSFFNQVVANTAAGAATTEQVNGGATRIVGGEGNGQLQVGTLAGWPTILDVGLRYTYSHATFVGGPNAGHFLPYAPLHSVNTNLDIEHSSGLGGQISYAHVSSQFTDLANTVAEDASGRVGLINGRHIVDVTAHYRHKPSGLSARLTVKNALDDVYVVARRPEGIFPAGFRQIILGLRWEHELAGK